MLKFLKLLLVPAIALMAVLNACNKSEDTVDATIEEAVDQSLYAIQERGGIGRYGCYELVFPLSIVLPDSSTVDVGSYEALKDTLRGYFQANGTAGGGHHGHGPRRHRPAIQFVFPISVLDQDGVLITVENEDALRELRADCRGTFGNHGPQGHGHHGLSCFDLVFPITLQFPDSSTVEVANRQEMRDRVREWRQNNPGVHGRPQLVFPITVQMTADSSLVTLNSKEELKQLKEDCE
jgi:hypothetical protein